MTILELKNLRKIYSVNDPPAVDGVDLTIKEGEVIVIIGASGSGKSTLLRCVNRLIEPTSGDIIFKGKSILKEDQDINVVRQKIGMVFQSFNLFTHLTALDNLTMALKRVQKKTPQEANKIAMDLMRRFGLGDKGDSYPSELSGGQQQRIGIMRALALNPDIMLFDEPTSALDPELVGGIIDIMEELAKEKMTMLVVTHEIMFAREAADRIIYMDEGKIIEQGPPDQLLDNPKNPRTIEFLSRI